MFQWKHKIILKTCQELGVFLIQNLLLHKIKYCLNFGNSLEQNWRNKHCGLHLSISNNHKYMTTIYQFQKHLLFFLHIMAVESLFNLATSKFGDYWKTLAKWCLIKLIMFAKNCYLFKISKKFGSVLQTLSDQKYMITTLGHQNQLF